MQVTVKSKLVVTEEQKQKFLQTMIRFNDACNYVSQIAFESKTYNKFKLQKLVYYDIRERFELSADFSLLQIYQKLISYRF